MAITYVLVSLEAGKERAVHDELSRIEGLKEQFPLFGEWELIAKLEAESLDKIGQIIVHQLRRIPGIRSTHTLTVAKL